MSRSQKLNNEDNNKIVRNVAAKGLESAIQCIPISSRSEKLNPSVSKTDRQMSATHSDGSIIKNQDQTGLKQKFVNKVKSWSTKDRRGLQSIELSSSATPSQVLTTIALDLESLNLADNVSEDDLHKPRAKDSLESLLGPKSDKIISGDAGSSRPCLHPTSSREKHFCTEAPHSDSFLGGGSSVDPASRVLTWDPWNKMGRKNKKEAKRRKPDKSPLHSRENSRPRSPIIKIINHTAGDEPRSSGGEPANRELLSLILPEQETYEYQPYQSNRKSVEFVNEVLVVYFTGDEVITKVTEPLKKELDQQTRNKEMRRGHIPCTMMGNRQIYGKDHVAV